MTHAPPEPRGRMAGRTSPVAGPAARHVRVFRFAFHDGRTAAIKAERRQAVLDHLDGWFGARVVREEQDGSRCRVTVAVERPVTVQAAEDHARECPRYVAGTFAAVSG